MRKPLVKHELSWTVGPPTHAWQCLTLQAGQLPNAPHWEQAPALTAPDPGAPSPNAVLLSLGDQVETVNQAVAQHDLDAAWAGLMEVAERYAAGRGLTSYKGPRAPSKVRRRLATGLFHQHRPKRRRPNKPARGEQRAPATAPLGLHDLVPLPGPIPDEVSQATRSASVKWTAMCVKCGQSSTHAGRWLKLLHSTCPDGTPGPVRNYSPHELVRTVGGWQ